MKARNNPTAYETFELRFEGCGHTMKIPLQHNSDPDRCFVCHPELRDVPASGKCPACVSAATHKSRGAGG
jgi:hypothetical protein